MNSIPATDPYITIMGRTVSNADGSRSFGYPGVSFFLHVNGSDLKMIASSNSGNGWLDISVDGGTPTAIQLAKTPQSYPLFHFSSAGEHSLRITHRTETWQAISTIASFQLSQGEFIREPDLPARKILFLGDSVTCGEMIDRAAGEERNARWSNALESYGLLTAKALNAQVQLVCYGGRGLVRSWNGKTDEQNLPDFYPLAIADTTNPAPWDQSQYDPDVIVSAIGTNDFSLGIPEREHYIVSYQKLLLKLLGNHKHAQIVLTEGAILNGEKKAALIEYIQEAARRTGDKRIHIATSNHYPGDAIDAHPSKAQHAAMAKDLIPQLQAIMKW